MVPQNNHNSNIKDQWSQITVTYIVIKNGTNGLAWCRVATNLQLKKKLLGMYNWKKKSIPVGNTHLKAKSVSYSVMSDSATPWTVAHQAPLSMGFSMQEYWSGLLFLLHRIFPTQGLNPGCLHCRQILYSLSYRGSPTHIYMHPYIYSVRCPLFHISVPPSEILFCLKNFLLVKWVLVY